MHTRILCSNNIFCADVSFSFHSIDLKMKTDEIYVHMYFSLFTEQNNVCIDCLCIKNESKLKDAFEVWFV